MPDPRGPALWRMLPGLSPYSDTIAAMERRVQDIRDNHAPDEVWLLEHPPLYTAGTGAKPEDLLNPLFPVFEAGRGGQYTYHGPGQRIAYAMTDLQPRHCDLRAYVRDLEEWIIQALAALGVTAARRDGLPGVWVGADKIAAIGVRVRKWVAFHGVAINVNPDLSHFAGIVPCGVQDGGVTSLKKLGISAGMDILDAALKKSYADIF